MDLLVLLCPSRMTSHCNKVGVFASRDFVMYVVLEINFVVNVAVALAVAVVVAVTPTALHKMKMTKPVLPVLRILGSPAVSGLYNASMALRTPLVLHTFRIVGDAGETAHIVAVNVVRHAGIG